MVPTKVIKLTYVVTDPWGDYNTTVSGYYPFYKEKTGEVTKPRYSLYWV